MGVCGIFISYTSYTAATHAHTVPTSVISYTYMLYMCACLRPRLCYENCHIIFYNELIALDLPLSVCAIEGSHSAKL